MDRYEKQKNRMVAHFSPQPKHGAEGGAGVRNTLTKRKGQRRRLGPAKVASGLCLS
jgi:hypothetical protein